MPALKGNVTTVVNTHNWDKIGEMAEAPEKIEVSKGWTRSVTLCSFKGYEGTIAIETVLEALKTSYETDTKLSGIRSRLTGNPNSVSREEIDTLRLASTRADTAISAILNEWVQATTKGAAPPNSKDLGSLQADVQNDRALIAKANSSGANPVEVDKVKAHVKLAPAEESKPAPLYDPATDPLAKLPSDPAIEASTNEIRKALRMILKFVENPQDSTLETASGTASRDNIMRAYNIAKTAVTPENFMRLTLHNQQKALKIAEIIGSSALYQRQRQDKRFKPYYDEFSGIFSAKLKQEPTAAVSEHISERGEIGRRLHVPPNLDPEAAKRMTDEARDRYVKEQQTAIINNFLLDVMQHYGYDNMLSNFPHDKGVLLTALANVSPAFVENNFFSEPKPFGSEQKAGLVSLLMSVDELLEDFLEKRTETAKKSKGVAAAEPPPLDELELQKKDAEELFDIKQSIQQLVGTITTTESGSSSVGLLASIVGTPLLAQLRSPYLVSLLLDRMLDPELVHKLQQAPKERVSEVKPEEMADTKFSDEIGGIAADIAIKVLKVGQPEGLAAIASKVITTKLQDDGFRKELGRNVHKVLIEMTKSKCPMMPIIFLDALLFSNVEKNGVMTKRPRFTVEEFTLDDAQKREAFQQKIRDSIGDRLDNLVQGIAAENAGGMVASVVRSLPNVRPFIRGLGQNLYQLMTQEKLPQILINMAQEAVEATSSLTQKK